jgi:hypothetical protein
MAVTRGSTAQITAIAEATPGTTPPTPAMVEMPVVSFTPNTSNTIIGSDAIRGHPFRDQISAGRLVHEIGLEVELAGATHDLLLETFLGGAITAKSLKFLDELKSMTVEEKVKAGVFNQWTYVYLNSMSIGANADDTAPVKMTFAGGARAGTLDAAATLATSVTPAPNTQPFTFIGATVTIAGNATPVGSGTLNFERTVDPLMLLGSALPREYVPGEATLTGTLTIPYDDAGNGLGATHSAILTNFTDAAQVWNFGNTGNTVFRKFTIPKTNYSSLGRALNSRGMRMQEINFEAKYDSATSTVATLTTE